MARGSGGDRWGPVRAPRVCWSVVGRGVWDAGAWLWHGLGLVRCFGALEVERKGLEGAPFALDGLIIRLNR